MRTNTNLRLAAAALAALAALACSEQPTAEPEFGIPEDPETKTFTIEASIDDGADSRVAMDDDGVSRIDLRWEPGDRIYVVNGSSSSETVYTFTVAAISADGKTASFSCPNYPVDGTKPAYAIHEGTAVHTGFNPTDEQVAYSNRRATTSLSGLTDQFPLYATYDAVSGRLRFKPVLSLLKLIVTLPADVSGQLSNFRIGSKNGDNLIYTIGLYDFTGEEPARTRSLDLARTLSGYGSLSGGTPTAVYVPLYPGTETAGKPLEITLVVGDYTCTAVVTGGNLVAGKCYPLTLPAAKWTAEKIYEGGTGTASDPYRIENEANLRSLAKAVRVGVDMGSKNFRLENDIAITGITPTEPWLPIGTDYGLFAGNFDGNGKTISGTLYFPDYMPNLGLFGYAAYGTISNLTFRGDAIIQDSKKSTIYIGGIVGSSSSTLSGCTHAGSVMASSSKISPTCYIGGIVGEQRGYKITGCTQTGGTITANASSGSVIAGGICGRIPVSNTELHTSRNESNVVVTAKYPYTGALVGDNSGKVFSCSTFSETVTVTENGTPQSPVKAIGYGNAIDESEHTH